MDTNNIVEKIEKILGIRIKNIDLQTPIKEITHKEALTDLDAVEKYIIELRRAIKKMPVIVEADRIPPGLDPHQVILETDKWLKERKMTNPDWEILWIHPKTGQVVYSKYLCDPEDDGYIKGFQIAFDISTNKMICRNCDNIWVSLNSRGFVRVEGSLEEFKTTYSKWTNK